MILTYQTPDAMNILVSILLLIVSYMLGSIPFGLLVGRGITGVDIREYGSGNIGSTNAVRVLGKRVGYLVFLCDVLKGAAVIIILKILNAAGVWTSCLDYTCFGVAAVLGHSYSCFLGFKGGKAVATSLGVVLMICPMAGILCLIAFAITFYSTGYVSVSSTVATLTVAITYWVLYFIGIPATSFGMYFISAPALVSCILIDLVGLVILYKHIPNYKRLAKGTESSFKKKPAKSE